MEINGFVKLFIDSIESANISISYEDLDTEDNVIRIELEDLPFCTVEISTTLDYMDVYCTFSYYDDYSPDREGNIDYESIESDVFASFEQKEFEKLLKHLPYKVDIWDDGCFLCPGYNARVGFYHISCDVAIIKAFVQQAKLFFAENAKVTLSEILNKQFLDVIHSRNVNEANLPFHLEIRKDIDYRPLPKNQVLLYIGEEYVFYKKDNSCGAILKDHYSLFMSVVDEIELKTDTYFELNGKFLRVVSNSFWADIPQQNIDWAIDYEQMYLDMRLSNIAPFLTESKLMQLVKKLENIDITGLPNMRELMLPHIYTEGHTDWKHIKHALSTMFPDKLNDLIFEEYTHNIEMGDQRLLMMCGVYSKEKNPHAKIMIFDRDNVQLKLIEDNEIGFKDWGNRVYSFAIPLPDHRQTTPNISIEHYYTDAEIMKEFEVGGIKRRLYFGYEFDKFGRAPKLGKMCRMANKCGEKSIAIIDDKVYDSNSLSDINYALSKTKFTEQICSSNLSSESKSAFVKLLQRIDSILQYDGMCNKRKR